MMTTINYVTKEPTIYNKGSKWEASCDTFLAYYTYKTIEEAKAEVEEMNRTHPTYAGNGEPINWEKIDHFFIDEQDMFDTKDSF